MTEGVSISAAQVKELRERTGVGMAKCKEALEQAKGDMEAAIDILRKQGMASAVKKEGRETKEGSIVVHEESDAIAIVEVNAETDFVAKNDKFVEFAKNIAREIALTKPQSLDAFMSQSYSGDKGITIDQYRSLIIQTIGENIQIRRLQLLKKEPSTSFGIYSHMNGKILTVVAVNGAGEEALARDVAMHVAATAPEFLNPEQVPQEIVQKEREIAQEQLKGKPAHIMDKILDGKVSAYYDMVCLTRQKFIKDDSQSVEEYIRKQGESRGKKDLKATYFLRWTVGQ